MISLEELAAIEERSRLAQPEETTHSLEYTCRSMKDVPVLIAEVKRLQKIAHLADRFCDCINEFGLGEAQYCSEWLEALETALEVSAARPAAAEGERR